MSIKELIEIVKLDGKSQLKLLYVLAMLAAFFAPGVLLLMLEGLVDRLYENTLVTLGLCLVVSIPFVFLGIVVYLHPRQTLVELSQKSATEIKWSILLGAGIWALISAGVSYAVVNTGQEFLSQLVSEKRNIQYIAVWLVQFGVFGIIFYINSSRPING